VEIGTYRSTRTPMKNTKGSLPQNLALSCPNSSSLIGPTNLKSFTGRYVEHHLGGVHSLGQIAFAASKRNTATTFLSATCSIYPRSLSVVAVRLEGFLSLSCPEAARNVLLIPDFMHRVSDLYSGDFRTDNCYRLAGNRDESNAKPQSIEDGVQLLQTVHRQTICFIDNYKGCRIRDSLEPGLVLVERVVVCWLKGQGMVGPVISVIPMLDTPSLVPTAKNIKRRPLFRTCRSLCYAAEKSASCPDVILYPRWCVDDFRSEEDSVDRPGIRSLSVPAVQRNDLLDSTVMNSR
jgi:hypothetical protein